MEKVRSEAVSQGAVVLTVGLMLFALFFGAGNMIFPAFLGQQAGNSVFLAIGGFLITGAGLPLLGIIAMGISKATDLRDLASRVHPAFGLVFTLLLYLTIGPFFALPRTATVAFEIGIIPLTAGSGVDERVLLGIFTLVFFAVSFALALRPGKIVDVIGKYLTPVLLVTITTLVGYSVIRPMGGLQAPAETFTGVPMVGGLLEGYNTMDGLGSLVFGTIVLNAIREKAGENANAMRLTVYAGMIAIFGLGTIYALIAYMGAISVAEFGHLENGAEVLALSAQHYFGVFGNVLLAVIIILACLTTSVGLLSACSGCFNKLVPKASYAAWLTGFTIFAGIVANVGLNAIITYSVPILVVLYPLTITLIVVTLAHRLFENERIVYGGTAAVVTPFALLDGYKALFGLPETVETLLTNTLPFFEIGLGWTIPALIGFVATVAMSWLWMNRHRDDTETDTGTETRQGSFPRRSRRPAPAMAVTTGRKTPRH